MKTTGLARDSAAGMLQHHAFPDWQINCFSVWIIPSSCDTPAAQCMTCLCHVCSQEGQRRPVRSAMCSAVTTRLLFSRWSSRGGLWPPQANAFLSSFFQSNCPGIPNTLHAFAFSPRAVSSPPLSRRRPGRRKEGREAFLCYWRMKWLWDFNEHSLNFHRYGQLSYYGIPRTSWKYTCAQMGWNLNGGLHF